MGRVRQTSFVYTGPMQMVVLLALFVVFQEDNIDVFQQIYVIFRSLGAGFSDSSVLSIHFSTYSLLYLQVGGVLVSCYLSGIACRLYMQRMAFAAPVMLVAPASMALALGCTPTDVLHWYDVSKTCRSPDLTQASTLLVLLVGVAVWLSAFLINTHVWFPEVERTAKLERSVLASRADFLLCLCPFVKKAETMTMVGLGLGNYVKDSECFYLLLYAVL